MNNLFSKFFYVLVIFVSYLFLAQNIQAFDFVKSLDNPLPITYIDNYVGHQQVHVFKENDIYKGIFSIYKSGDTFKSLGYFESPNGINWQMKKEIVNTRADLSNPSIMKTQTGYLLFLTRYDDNVIYRIYGSNCDLEFNCSSSFIPIIFPDVSNSSEKKGVFAVRTFQQDNRTYMFFGAWGDNGFKLKLAYSDDLLSWQRCPNEFLYGGDGPFPYQIDNDLYLFFHRSDSSGIRSAKTSLPLSCDSNFQDLKYELTRGTSYDQRHMIFPSVIQEVNGLKLYYSGRDANWNWNLDLACTGQACLSPTETPTPTLIPTPTLVPEKTPIVIIPGFMASWNRDAILHNQTVNYFAWKLQNFVKEYEGLINSLKNIGYIQNVNLFLFPYDWRQSIEKTTSDLNYYLQEKIWNEKPNQKINIVGHSLGGLIGRIFSQKNIDKVNKIITVGSPHQGAVQVYKPIESGEIDRENTFLWLAEKVILFLNKSTIESDKITFNNSFPVAKDLFPTFNFLKDLQGNEIPVDSLTIKNSYLSTYNQNFSEIFSIFTAVYGEKDNNTPAGYIIEPQNIVDQLLGNYSDGKPKEPYFDLGDYTILSKSSSQDTDSEKFYFDHGEIISKKEAIKKILGLLNINFIDDQIVEGQITKISSSLIFLIKSPATMTVQFANDIYQEDEGIIFIPDAQSGTYNLKVQGTNQGKYEVIVGQVSENNDIWESINGEINQLPASSQIDDYNILYNNQAATSMFPTPTVTPKQIPSPTVTPTVMLTITPTLQPTSSSSNNQSVQLKNDEISMSKEPMPAVLGISSRQEELISPTIIENNKQTKTKILAKKSSNILDYVWPPIISLILGGIGYLFRKKIIKK